MARVTSTSTGEFRQRIAAGLVWLYVLQSVIRLSLTVPLHGFDRETVVMHAWGLIALAAVVSAALILSRRRRVAQFALALALGAFGVLGTIYDIAAFVSGLLLHKALSLAAIGSFYCSERGLGACAADYWHLTALVAIWALAWATAIVFCTDALAALAIRWLARLNAIPLVPRWLDARYGIAALVVGYAACWLAFPTFARAHEPLYMFLTNRAFVQGPVELVTIPRPDYRPAPSPRVGPRPLIMITVDSLRADAVQLRPGPSLTPFLRELARSGRLHNSGAATAICGSSYCGIIALQSSSDWATQQLGPPLTLPDVLAANGYRSIFLLSGPHRTAKNLGALYGPRVTTLMDDASPDSAGLSDDREQVRRLRRVPIADPARIYLSIHLMSAHSGGRRFGEGRSSDILDYTTYYRNGVRQADGVIRDIFAILKARRLLDDALVIITADHGERIGSGEIGHYARIDRATVAIPLLIYDGRGGEWPAQSLASQLDVAPTLLAAAGIGKPATWRGQALQSSIARAAVPTDSYEHAGMVGLFGGRRVLYLCETRTGATEVRAFGRPALTAEQRTRAIAQAPALHAGLATRHDARRCFSPIAAQPRS